MVTFLKENFISLINERVYMLLIKLIIWHLIIQMSHYYWSSLWLM